MLVLSRGNNDKIVFPTLGISVEILRIAGNKVRLGIDAPKDVPVYRHEIAEQIGEFQESTLPLSTPQKNLTHSIRNRLHSAALGLHVLHRKLELEDPTNAEAEIFKIFNDLKAIEQELEGDPPGSYPQKEKLAHRALVVEDDDNERELLSGYLQMSGFEVDTAVDGMQAMVRLTNVERPDVVLLDMKMPRFDGKKTISAIRDNPAYRDLKVFAVSGTDRSETQVSVGAKGVNRWFSKPLDPRELVNAIHEELGSESLSV